MGMLEVARDALKDVPISEVIRERLLLALDRLEETEAKVSASEKEIGRLQAQLEREQFDHEHTKNELQALQELLREQVRFVRGVEFRKSSRTGNEWQPFCPKCHLPIVFSTVPSYPMSCQDHHCGWTSSVESFQVESERRRELD